MVDRTVLPGSKYIQISPPCLSSSLSQPLPHSLLSSLASSSPSAALQCSHYALDRAVVKQTSSLHRPCLFLQLLFGALASCHAQAEPGKCQTLGCAPGSEPQITIYGNSKVSPPAGLQAINISLCKEGSVPEIHALTLAAFISPTLYYCSLRQNKSTGINQVVRAPEF